MALKFEAEGWPEGLDISLTPLRRVIRRSSVICNGWHRTRKHPLGYLPGESQNELLFLVLAEMDPGVTAVAAQPTKITTSTRSGRLFSHIPDYAVLLNGSPVLIEAKPDDKAARPETIERLRRAAEHAGDRGYDYRLALRGEMLGDGRMPGVEAIWRYFRPDFGDTLRLRAANVLRKHRMPVRDLLDALQRTPGLAETTFEQVLSLIANGHVFFDHDMPVDEGAMVRFPDRSALPETLLPARRPRDPIGCEVRP
jgi:hypothetical protein